MKRQRPHKVKVTFTNPQNSITYSWVNKRNLDILDISNIFMAIHFLLNKKFAYSCSTNTQNGKLVQLFTLYFSTKRKLSYKNLYTYTNMFNEIFKDGWVEEIDEK